MTNTYCRNCGHALIGVPYYCMNCGARPENGRSFCPACANPTSPLSEICVKCGLLLVKPAAVVLAAGNKSKGSAVLLAVFLSAWSWIYTYQKDSWKLWIALGSWVFMLLLLSAGLSPFLWLIVLGVWVWVIVDRVRKPEDWYRQYGA